MQPRRTPGLTMADATIYLISCGLHREDADCREWWEWTPELEFGYFTDRDAAEQKVAELVELQRPAYDAYAIKMTAALARDWAAYDQFTAQNDAVTAAGLPPLSETVRKPALREPLPFERWRGYTDQARWEVIELNLAKENTL